MSLWKRGSLARKPLLLSSATRCPRLQRGDECLVRSKRQVLMRYVFNLLSVFPSSRICLAVDAGIILRHLIRDLKLLYLSGDKSAIFPNRPPPPQTLLQKLEANSPRAPNPNFVPHSTPNPRPPHLLLAWALARHLTTWHAQGGLRLNFKVHEMADLPDLRS